MPYRTVLIELKQQLLNNDNNLWLFLQTNNNIYSFRSELTPAQQLEIVDPVGVYLNNKEFNKYDALERIPNTIYYISEEMQEYQLFLTI